MDIAKGGTGTETVLYADVLFLVDFSMDYLSLYAVSKILSLKTTLWRSAIAAAVGGLYGVFAVLLGVDGLIGALGTVAVSVLLALITFGVNGGWRGTIRTTVTVWGCGALLGGIMTAFTGVFGGSVTGGSGDILCAGAVAMFGFLRLVRRHGMRGSAEITLVYEKQIWHGSALIDSGNLLTDPIGGYAVILLRAAEARILLGNAADTVYKGNIEHSTAGVRVVPVRTVDGTRLLYGFLAKDIAIHRGKQTLMRTAVVCVDHGAAADGYGGCAALLPASLVL